MRRWFGHCLDGQRVAQQGAPCAVRAHVNAHQIHQRGIALAYLGKPRTAAFRRWIKNERIRSFPAALFGVRQHRPNSRGRAMRRGARRCNARLSKARPSRRPQRTSSLHQIRRDAQPCRASHGSARHSKDRESGVTAYVNADHITAARGIDRQPVSMQVAARPVQSGRAERNLRTYKHGRP